jgi:hypothetical protein
MTDDEQSRALLTLAGLGVLAALDGHAAGYDAGWVRVDGRPAGQGYFTRTARV